MREIPTFLFSSRFNPHQAKRSRQKVDGIRHLIDDNARIDLFRVANHKWNLR